MSATLSTSPTVKSLTARGPLSSALLDALGGAGAGVAGLAEQAVAEAADVLHDDDIQLSLFLLYASVYGSVPELDPRYEWDPQLTAVRRLLEDPFEAALRELVPMDPLPEPAQGAVASALFALTSADAGPSLSRYLAKKATRE